MKIIFCSRQDSIDALKDNPTAHKTSKIKTKFSDPKYIRNIEFRSVSNIEYLEFSEVPVYSTIYDSLMNRQLFEHNFHNLDHSSIFEKYVEFNKKMAEKINEILEDDDLVVVNDSSLLLLPTLVKARVAIRNISFDGCFIEKLAFYSEIIKSIVKAQKFFDTEESMNSFELYIRCSYEFSGFEKGGCWCIKPYIEKFLLLDTLEKIRQVGKNKIERDNDMAIYLKAFDFPKKVKTILIDSNLLHLEPFIKENPDVHIRYLRPKVEFNEELERMMQYLKKMYHNRISVADPIDYSHIVAEMFFCDVFIGTKYHELAQFFGRKVIKPTFDSFLLKDQVFNALRSDQLERYDVPGEEEYLMEFLNANGYELVIEKDRQMDEHIENILLELNETTRPHSTPKDYFERIREDGTKEYYSRKEDVVPQPLKISCLPLRIGSGGYLQLKKRTVPKELLPIDIEKIKEFWKKSNKTILLDYDGTLTPIVNDPDKAYPSERMIEILLRLNSKGKVVVCSGRRQAALDEWIPKEIEVYSEHGAFNRINGEWKSLFTSHVLVERCLEIMKYYVTRTPGTRIEKKEAGIVFHYREADKIFDEGKLYSLLRRIGGENVILIKKGIEFKTGSKKDVTRRLEPAICAGDDTVDEDMFLNNKGVSIRVGPGKSFADGYVEDVPAFINLLDILSKVE